MFTPNAMNPKDAKPAQRCDSKAEAEFQSISHSRSQGQQWKKRFTSCEVAVVVRREHEARENAHRWKCSAHRGECSVLETKKQEKAL